MDVQLIYFIYQHRKIKQNEIKHIKQIIKKPKSQGTSDDCICSYGHPKPEVNESCQNYFHRFPNKHSRILSRRFLFQWYMYWMNNEMVLNSSEKKNIPTEGRRLEVGMFSLNYSIPSSYLSYLKMFPLKTSSWQKSLWARTNWPILWNKFKNLTWFTAELYAYSVVVFQPRKTCFILYTHLLFIFDKSLYIINFLWKQEKQIMVHAFNI
jgi:hypothetical protein